MKKNGRGCAKMPIFPCGRRKKKEEANRPNPKHVRNLKDSDGRGCFRFFRNHEKNEEQAEQTEREDEE